jgi:hypothetical protein
LIVGTDQEVPETSDYGVWGTSDIGHRTSTAEEEGKKESRWNKKSDKKGKLVTRSKKR